jgi:DNA-binding HxlR family transcriptional regulator
MLALQLKELVEARIVYKSVQPVSTTFNIEYTLSKLGKSLVPLIMDMNVWGKKYLAEIEKMAD